MYNDDDDDLQRHAEELFRERAQSGGLSFLDFQDTEVTRLRACCAEEGETGPEFSDIAHLVSIEYLLFDDLTDSMMSAFHQEALGDRNLTRDIEETNRELDRWVTHG